MLQLSLKLQEAADGEFPLKVFSEEVGGEGGAAAACLQGVARGGAIAVTHAHAGLRPNDALDLWWAEKPKCQTGCFCSLNSFHY